MSRPIQVMKFGGTSVGDADRIRSAAAIAAEASKHRAAVVVVSAMSSVTNTLIAAAGKAAKGDESAAEALTKALQEKHHEAIGKLISDVENRRELLSEIDALQIIAAAAHFWENSLLARST
jgi:aspartokinase